MWSVTLLVLSIRMEVSRVCKERYPLSVIRPFIYLFVLPRPNTSTILPLCVPRHYFSSTRRRKPVPVTSLPRDPGLLISLSRSLVLSRVVHVSGVPALVEASKLLTFPPVTSSTYSSSHFATIASNQFSDRRSPLPSGPLIVSSFRSRRHLHLTRPFGP